MPYKPVLLTTLLEQKPKETMRRIVDAYAASDFNGTATARRLRVSRATWARWMRDYPELASALGEEKLRAAEKTLAKCVPR